MKLPSLITALLILSSCTESVSDIDTQSDGVAAKDRYERAFRWSSPRPCDIFLHERITDEQLRLVQYTLQLDGEEYVLLYELDEDEALPIRVTAFSITGSDALIVEASDEALAVYDAAGELIYEVLGYDAQDPRLTRVLQHRELPRTKALEVMSCALPARAELGAVPAFLRNLGAGGRLPGSDVVAMPENAPPILDWNSELSILGSLVLQSACTTSTWACPCLRWEEPYTGPVSGWCSDDGAPGTPSTSPDRVRAEL